MLQCSLSSTSVGSFEVDDDNVEVGQNSSSSCERVVDEGGTPRWRLIDVERACVFRQMPQTDLRDILRELPNRSSDGMQVVLTRFLDGTLPSVDQLEPGDLAYVKQLYLWFGLTPACRRLHKIQISSKARTHRWRGSFLEGLLDGRTYWLSCSHSQILEMNQSMTNS